MTWANIDLPRAIAWVGALPQDEGKNSALVGLAYEAVRTDPFAALRLAATLPASPARDDLLVHTVSQWAISDADAAAAWARGVPDASLQRRLLATVAVALSVQDGPAAARLASQELSPGEELDRAAVSIIERWGQTSPAAAGTWAAQFPETTRQAALQNLASAQSEQLPR